MVYLNLTANTLILFVWIVFYNILFNYLYIHITKRLL